MKRAAKNDSILPSVHFFPVSTYSIHSSKRLIWNFALFSALFGINHGSINVVLNYATTEFSSLGNISTSLVYIGYVFCAMTLASGLSQILGPKNTIVLGSLMYACYVSSFFLVLHSSGNNDSFFTAYRTIVIVCGSVCGGFAAGFVWVGQGAYLAYTSEHCGSRHGGSVQDSNALLGGLFVAIYIGLEVLLMGSASWLLSHNCSISSLVFGLSIAAFLSSCAIFFFLLELSSLENSRSISISMKDDLFQAVRLLVSNRKLQLMYPYCVAFGFIDALVITFLNELVGLSPVLGDKSLGYINTIPPFMATIVSLPLAYLSTKIGSLPVLVFGALNFLFVGFIVALTSEQSLTNWGWFIVVIYVFEGLGRGVYEGTCRAVFCDFFPQNSEAAFSNIIMAAGTSTGIASFLFTKGILTQTVIGWTCVGLTSVAIISMLAAFRVHKSERSRFVSEKSALLHV